MERTGASEFFATNTTDPNRWTPTSCFGLFRTVSLQHELHRKMGWTGSLMHKFVQQYRVGYFHNKRTKYTSLDPRLVFCVVSDHSVTIRTLVQNGPNWCHYCTSSCNNDTLEFFATNALDTPHWNFVPSRYWMNFSAKWAKLVPIMHKFVQHSRFGIFCRKTYPIHAIGPQTHVLGCFGLFRYWMNFCAKRVEQVKLMHKFVQPSRVQIFRKPFHYCTNLGANRAELGSLMHKFLEWCRLGNFRNERTRYSPLDPKHMFCGILDHSITGWTLVQNGPNRWN
jgi:hypothetical protein